MEKHTYLWIYCTLKNKEPYTLYVTKTTMRDYKVFEKSILSFEEFIKKSLAVKLHII